MRPSRSPHPARRPKRPGLLPVLLGALALVCVPCGAARAQELPSPSLRLEARVSPSPAPFGDSVTFRLSITNTGETLRSLELGGCPVRCRVDGEFTPGRDCDGPSRTIELDPGQSLTLGPEDSPLLVLDPRVYPLAPGVHRVVLAAEGVGAADAEFQVLPPDAGHGAIGGRWLTAGGAPVAGGVVVLGKGVARDRGAEEAGSPDVARSRPSEAGGFLFTNVEPGTYLLRAVIDGRALWYPGVRNPLLARPVAVEDGAYRTVILEAPPSETWTVEGSVFELSPSPAGQPLPGVVVVAIPAWPARGDARAAGSEFPTAVTDPDGRFRIELPEGFFRLAAGKLASHRYQFWDHVAGGAPAGWIRVPGPRTGPAGIAPGAPAANPPAVRFDLEPLQNAEVAVIRGLVLGMDPRRQDPPVPLADAEVLAIPLVPAEDAAAAPHRTRTGPDGAYRLEVPADTPYWVQAAAPGRRSGTFRYAVGLHGATWVDVAPGRFRDGVDLFLPPAAESASGTGTAGIQGTVSRPVPGEGLDPSRCLVPAPGVRVRVATEFPSHSVLELWTRTDGEGRYRIEGLPAEPGSGLTYRVLASLEEDPLTGGVTTPRLRAAITALPVRPGQSADAGRLVLAGPEPVEAPGKIRGWVFDSSGAPIRGAQVAVYPDPENPDAPVVLATTDGEGAFLAAGLPPEAEAVLSARAEGFVPGYYPGVHRWRESKRVTVEAEPEAGVRLLLDPAPGGAACFQTGRILRPVPPEAGESTGTAMTGPERGPVVGAFTYLEPVGDGERQVAGGMSGDNGTVIITGIAAGKYRIVADRPGFEPGFLETPSGEELDVTLEATASPGLAEITLLPVGYLPAESRDAGEVRPMLTALGNAPNPFRPRTAIRYRLAEAGAVSAFVFDYRGRLIRTLLEGEEQPPGARELEWDGRDEDGDRVSAGVYFYRVVAAGYSVSSKMVVLP